MTAEASSTMVRRAAFLVALLVVEALVASLFLDGGTLVRKGGTLSHFIALWGEWVVRGCIGFAALFATFAYLKHRSTLRSIAAEAAATPLHRGLLLLHAVAIGTFAALSAALYGPAGQAIPLDVLSVLWIFAAAAAVASLAFAVAPAAAWIRLVQSTGRLWLYAAIASTAACVAGALSWAL